MLRGGGAATLWEAGYAQCRGWEHPVGICEGHRAGFKRMVSPPGANQNPGREKLGARGGAHPSTARPGPCPGSLPQEGPLVVLRPVPSAHTARACGHCEHKPLLCSQTDSGVPVCSAPTWPAPLLLQWTPRPWCRRSRPAPSSSWSRARRPSTSTGCSTTEVSAPGRPLSPGCLPSVTSSLSLP